MLHALRVDPGTPARIAERETDDRLGVDKDEGEKRLEHLVEKIDELQYRLHGEDRRSILLVLQGLDASGKDGVVRRVFDGVNPTAVRVTSFKVPAGAETQHDYLWRIHAALPAHGEIGVFNRSHYEDVVAVRMYDLAPEKVWRRRYEHIRAFERMLVDEGTTVLKVFLNVSRDEQRARFQERIDDPVKRWKFRRDDLKVRERFDDWIAAWEEVLTETSTGHAPWYVVPADRNWVKGLAVAELVAGIARAARSAAARARGRARGAPDRVTRAVPVRRARGWNGYRDVGIAAVDSDVADGGEARAGCALPARASTRAARDRRRRADRLRRSPRAPQPRRGRTQTYRARRTARRGPLLPRPRGDPRTVQPSCLAPSREGRPPFETLVHHATTVGDRASLLFPRGARRA